MMRIDRCICFDVPFAALKEAARVYEIRDLEDLQQVVPFGMKCRLCHPYVRRMLATGETVFTEVLQNPE